MVILDFTKIYIPIYSENKSMWCLEWTHLLDVTLMSNFHLTIHFTSTNNNTGGGGGGEEVAK